MVAISVHCSHFWVDVLGVIGGGLAFEVNFMKYTGGSVGAVDGVAKRLCGLGG